MTVERGNTGTKRRDPDSRQNRKHRRSARKGAPALSQAFHRLCRGRLEFSEITLNENRSDLNSIRFRERVMVDVSGRELSTTMLGENVAMPLALGPVGMCGAIWSNGEILSCRAAQDFGVPFTLSTNALLSIDDVAEGVERPFWFQLYLEKDRGFSEHLIDRAKTVGCPVLVLTMDLHVEGIRYVDAHNGLGAPPKLTPANIWSIMSHPSWALAMLHSKRWSFGNYADRTKSGNVKEMAELVRSQLDASFDAKTVQWVRRTLARQADRQGDPHR